MDAVHEYQDFYASHDHMPGSSQTLRVSGTVVFRTSGWTCRLERAEGNTGINPEMLVLNLVMDGPDEGTVVQPVLTPCPVEWSEDDPGIHYQQVEFRVVGPDDEPPGVLTIEHPQ